MVRDHTRILGLPNCVDKCSDVKKEMERVIEADISMEPQLFCLRCHLRVFSCETIVVILHVLLTTARKLLTINWMNPNPPALSHWTQNIYDRIHDGPGTIKTAYFQKEMGTN